MRIDLLLEQAVAPVPGGTGRYSVQLAAALARLPEIDVRGYTAWHRDPSAAAVEGVEGPVRLPLGRRALVAAWERGIGPGPSGADIVHAPTLLVPPRRRRPLVVTIHDAVPWTHPETLTPRGVHWHRRMAQRATATADAVIVPSAATARALAEHLDLRSEPDVIPLGVTALPPPPDARSRLQRLGIASGGYVLSLATLEPRKGLDVLVQAMARPEAPDLPLVLVGATGWGGLDLGALAADAGLDPHRLRVLGRLDDADLAAALSAATVLAVPSRAEGFGLPVLEGMAAGVPVVTSQDPALREVGGSATLSSATGDPGSLAVALGRVCADAGLRAALASAGAARAAAYSWSRTAEQHLAVYRRLL